MISKDTLLTGVLWPVLILAVNCFCDADASGAASTASVELARHQKEFSTAHLEPARMDGQRGVAVIFEGTDDLHYYAKPETAPAAGFELKVEAKADGFEFGQAIFPKWELFTDSADNKVEVYVGRFTVFVPITTVTAETKADLSQADVEVNITGQTCTSTICLMPFEKVLRTQIDYTQRESFREISIETDTDAETKVEVVKGPSYSVWFALVMAFLAGLSLNIMPCVWPVLPIIVMRIVEQAKAGRRQSIVMGLAFCLGILLFFACLAGANIILQVSYGTVLQWGDQFRNPVFVAVMALLLVVLALFMFGVFTITVPSSIAGKSGSGKGYPGAVGMGFLAAILSTPCSFAILAAAFAWAQAQPLPLGTLAIMIIGVGMAAPYAILTSIPRLLKRLPKPGRWMELFKQAIGFFLLLIAVKLIAALPELSRMSVLYFAVVLGFCIWMWGSWVGYGTKLSRKLVIRGIAVVLVIMAWFFFFAPQVIDWQEYDGELIKAAIAQQRPVLIKFTADWCANCAVVDRVVYRRKDIAKLIGEKGVLAIKADTTGTGADYPATRALEKEYGEPGVPVSILYMPGEKVPVRLHEIFFAKKIKKILQKLPSKK
ncbi:MAG: protein-disulfide reductase DsbD family protein [Planctomycetota bacterium]